MRDEKTSLYCVVCNRDLPVQRAKDLNEVFVGSNGSRSSLGSFLDKLLRSTKNELSIFCLKNTYSCTYCVRVLLDFASLFTKVQAQQEAITTSIHKTFQSRKHQTSRSSFPQQRSNRGKATLKLSRVPATELRHPDNHFIDLTLEILDDQESAVMNVEFVPDTSDLQTEKGLFACRFCPREFTKAGFALEHMKTTHGGIFLKCDKCEAEFRSRLQLNDHKKLHLEDVPKPFHCTTCSQNFETPELLETHFKTHDLLKKYGCGQCGRKFAHESRLVEHIAKHGKKPFSCMYCSKTFSSRKVCSRHQKLQHGISSLRFPCSICLKTFSSAERLHLHIKNHNKRFRCKICGKRFETVEGLQEHQAAHNGTKLFICEQCGKSFAKKLDLDSHVRSHTGEKPFQCEFCGAMFSQKANLSSHVSAVHLQERRYKCTLCHKGFKRRRLLVYHMRSVHTGDRPYRCSFCSAAFVYPGHFKKHLLAHSGIKPFSCEICGKKFSSRDNRNTHRFTHSNRKPYECKVCGSSFMRKPALLNHLETSGHGDPETAGATVKIVQVITDPETEVLPTLDDNVSWDLVEPSQLSEAPELDSTTLDTQTRTIIIPDENGDPVQIEVIDSESANPLSYYLQQDDNFEVIEAIGLQDNFQVMPDVENDDVSLVNFV